MSRIILILIFFIFQVNLFADDEWSKSINYVNGVLSISSPDSNTCFVLNQNKGDFGYGPQLFRSTNHGKTWDSIYQYYPNEFPHYYNGFQGESSSPNHYFYSVWDIPVIESSFDGGKTFQRTILDTVDLYSDSRQIYYFAMYDSNYGCAVTPLWIFLTKDGWKTFEQRKYKEIRFDSFCFLDSNTLAIASLTPNWFYFVKYYINEDKLDTVYHFGIDSASSQGNFIVKIYFINDSVGYAVGFRSMGIGETRCGLIYRTKDSGFNWELILKECEKPNFGLEDISFLDEKNGIASGYVGKVYFTKDGGDTWVKNIPNEFAVTDTRHVFCGWAGHYPIIGTWDAGGIFRYEGDFFGFPPDTTDDTTGVNDGVRDILGNIEISIRQSHSFLQIAIQDENFRKYKFQISDIYGRIIKEEELNSGIGTLFMPVDISNLISGVYLYKIAFNGFECNTGKLNLIR